MKKVGIIGYGSFGAFAAQKLAQHLSVIVSDPNKNVPKEMSASLGQVCQADYLILAIPLSAYPSVLKEIAPMLAPRTILVDIASVKLEPIRLIQELVPNQKFIATHPLFGPESAAEKLEGHVVIFCESNCDDVAIDELQNFCSSIGLKVESMSADEHDRQMAVVQGLTFFIARALTRYGLHEMKFRTPSFQRLVHLAELDQAHSDELLKTILVGNTYALEARRKFMQDIETLDAEINHRDET